MGGGDTKTKIDIILKEWEKYASAFTRKHKMIKLSLYLFTSAEEDRSYFEKNRPGVEEYLGFIESKLIKKSDSVLSLISLL